jgi:hypothetical protein
VFENVVTGSFATLPSPATFLQAVPNGFKFKSTSAPPAVTLVNAEKISSFATGLPEKPMTPFVLN